MEYPSENNYFVFEIVEIDDMFYPKIYIAKPSMFFDNYWTFVSEDMKEWDSVDCGYKWCKHYDWGGAYTTLDKFRKLMKGDKKLIERNDFLELRKEYKAYQLEMEIEVREMLTTRYGV